MVLWSAAVGGWLLGQGLVDELNRIPFPVIVGDGRRLFPRRGPDFGLQLLASDVFSTGIVALTYRIAGRPEYA
mgnify:CR=1 FL=1